MPPALLRLASLLFPRWVARQAYRQLTQPQVRKLRDHEQAVLDQAEKSRLDFQGFDIQLYQWGQGTDAVLLVHGWEGQAGNFSDWVSPLLAAGFTVYAFDAPSHGHSSPGQASLFEFGQLVEVLIERLAVRKLLSHSFGGVATTFALQDRPDLHIEKYGVLTIPNRFLDYVEDLSQRLGMTAAVQKRLLDRVHRETGYDPADMVVGQFVQRISSVQSVLILHDEADRVIPLAKAQDVAAAWPIAHLEPITGTGHFRILRTPAVVERMVGWLASP
jgi:pimeloyl-ACP methyl ester carboxylesterase